MTPIWEVYANISDTRSKLDLHEPLGGSAIDVMRNGQ